MAVAWGEDRLCPILRASFDQVIEISVSDLTFSVHCEWQCWKAAACTVFAVALAGPEVLVCVYSVGE